MPITTKWYDEDHQVIFQKYEGKWTWEDLNRESALKLKMAESVQTDVILFSDMSESGYMPQGNLFSQGRSVFTHLSDNITQIIIVIESPMIKGFTKIAIDMVPSWRSRIKIAKTMEEGQKLVEEAVAKVKVSSS